MGQSVRVGQRHGAALLLLLAAPAAATPIPLAAPDVAISSGGRIKAIARQSDGSLIIGGEFTRIDGVARRNLARLHADGTLDVMWNASTDSGVDSIAVDARDDVFVSGMFNHASGEPRTSFAKFGGHRAGAVDPAWNPGASLATTYSPPKLALGTDGSVFAFQSFFHNDAFGDRYIVKISPSGSGSIDFSWNPAVPYVTAVAADRSAALYIGAYGNDADGCVRKVSSSGSGAAIADWHVSLGGACQPGALATAADGALYASSELPFDAPGGGQRYIVRFAPDSEGEIDAGWSPDILQPVRTLDVGDATIHANLRPVDGIAGAVVALATATGARRWQVPAGQVYALAVGADGSVYAGAEFEESTNPAPGGQAKLSLARLAGADGAPLPTVDATSPGNVLAIARQPNGGLIIGGRFVRAGTTPRKNLLRLRPDGALDPDWNAPGADDVVALAIDANGDVLAGLSLRSDTAPQPVRRYAAGSGALDPDWSVSIGGNGSFGTSITSLALDGLGHLYVLGYFDRIGAALRPGLARFAAESGTLDAWTMPSDDGWMPGADELAIAPDGTLYVAKNTTSYAGLEPQYSGQITRIDPGNDSPAIVWTRSLTGYPTSIAIAPDGSLLATGYFEINGSQVTADLLKLSPQGEIDALWTAATASTDEQRIASAVAVDARGMVYISGTGTTLSPDGSVPYRPYLMRRSLADGAVGGAWQPSIDGLYISQLVLASPGVLVVGGSFAAIGGVTRDSIAALATTPPEQPTHGHSQHARPGLVPPPPAPSPARLRPAGAPTPAAAESPWQHPMPIRVQSTE